MSQTATNPAKRHVRYFISYSHKDFESRTEGPKFVEFKELLMTKMKLSPEFAFEHWDDFQILPGDGWRQEIESKLSECDFGLVIVSENLLASDFITKVELPVFVDGERPFVPLAFGTLDFSRDMQGLQDQQVFRLRRPGEEPRALAQCNTPQLKNEFASDLVHQIEKKLRRQSVKGKSGADSSAFPKPNIAPSRKSQAELEDDLKNVFGTEYGRIKSEFENNKALSDLVISAFGIPEGPPEITSLRLMIVFYTNFLDSLGRYSQLYHDCDDKDGFVRLVASCIYLAMDADYARGLREKQDVGMLEISNEARNGIIQLLLKWTNSRAPLLLDDFKEHHSMNSPECLPTQRFDDIRINLLRKYGIDAKDSDANEQLAEKLSEEKSFGTPRFQRLGKDEQETIQMITAEGSPLKDLFILIVKEGSSIDPNRTHFDRQFESYLDRFLRTLKTSKA